ncbi:hypothetical protein N7466_009747 [Penicillium verhagenii]|uniref:uncharacterized protein n=1 Tax=Penicillium verhagenii TaxID=1562060 RepID=UPI0025459F27|nr:uncharacterized protein N7466_009747 [Penicillium verhagenii]KAJ5921421.1 hypothetical protein N7466_009747 [Penicillium verhagenii]
MTENKPRIILEKSSTVRRRYQRSNKVFRFTAEQLRRMEREEQQAKRAKEIREKDARRIANKKKKAEADAKAREEARRLGVPDPNAGKIPASQPLLSKFLCFGKPSRSEESAKSLVPGPDPKTAPEESAHEDSSPEPVDEHVCDEPPPDPLDEPVHEEPSTGPSHEPVHGEPSPEPVNELKSDESPTVPSHAPAYDEPSPGPFDGSTYKETTPGLVNEPTNHNPPLGSVIPALALPEYQNDFGYMDMDSQAGDTEPDSDYFDDLDEDMEKELYGLEDAGASNDIISHNLPLHVSQEPIGKTRDDDEFSDCSAFDDEDIIKGVEAAAATRANRPAMQPPMINNTLLQPPIIQPHPKNGTSPLASFAGSLNESFRDDTADFLEDVFARGSGESFGELMQLGS